MPIQLPARILIADDHAVVRRGVKALFARREDMQVTAEAVDGADAVHQALTADVDIAILDIAMPKLTGLQAMREIRRRRTNLPMLLLSMHESEQYFFEALAVGASGYVLKRQSDRDLVEACHSARHGGSFIYPPALGALMRHHLERVKRGVPCERGLLTLRESQVVKLIAEGHSSRVIAEMLTISPKTVARHRDNVLDKLGMRDRVDVTRYAIRAGLIEP